MITGVAARALVGKDPGLHRQPRSIEADRYRGVPGQCGEQLGLTAGQLVARHRHAPARSTTPRIAASSAARTLSAG